MGTRGVALATLCLKSVDYWIPCRGPESSGIGGGEAHVIEDLNKLPVMCPSG